ncbi:MAG: hypothetical protein ACAI38_21440 [Myxococcota bacterium]
MIEQAVRTHPGLPTGVLTVAPAGANALVARGIPTDKLLGSTLAIDTRGCTTVTNVLPGENAYYLRGVREALSLSHLAHEGAAVCLNSGTTIGNAKLLPPAKTPHWLDKAERSCQTKVLHKLFGRLDFFPKFELKPGSLDVPLPEDIRQSSSALRFFCIEMCGAALAVPFDDARKELTAQGYADTRWFERGESLALVTVSPDKRAIVVAWRCAADITTLIGAFDRRTFDDGAGEHVFRGVNRYIGQIREPLNEYLRELMAKHPKAELVMTSNSLGGAAIVQWAEQEIRGGLIPQERIAQMTVFNPPAGLGPERTAALATKLGKRLDVVVNLKDPVRWLFGLDRVHKKHATYIDDGSSRFNWFGLPSIKNAVKAHLLGALRRVIKSDLKIGVSGSLPTRNLRPES